jgi:cobalt/nickel transport protein
MTTESTATPASGAGRSRRTKIFVLAGLLVALALAGIGSFYASSDPDGLTKVSDDKGFAGSEKQHDLTDAPLAGYDTKEVDNDRLSGGVAGVIGVGVTFVIAGGAAVLIRRSGKPADGSGNPADAGTSPDPTDGSRDPADAGTSRT